MRIDMALADSGKLQVLSPKLALKRVSEGITNVCGWASALAGILLVGMVFLIAVTVIKPKGPCPLARNLFDVVGNCEKWCGFARMCLVLIEFTCFCYNSIYFVEM